MDTNRFATHSLRDERILRILAAALEAVDPFKAVQKYLPSVEGRVFGLGIGKAAVPMMDALAERIPITGGLAITKFASGLSRDAYTILEGGHPIPDGRSLHAGERVLQFVSSLEEDDTLICLISGGGSALVTAPYVPLEDLQNLTSLLLSSGARIDEINILRRQLDRVKGGGIARATKAKIIGLILSDVIGNPLEAIASGPTVPDPTTKVDAITILKKYSIEQKVPKSILDVLFSVPSLALARRFDYGLRRSAQREDGSIDERVQNIIIGDNKLAAQAALEQAQQEGFQAEVLTNQLQGEACEVGRDMARRLRMLCMESSTRSHPFCLIAGGETTVTIKGKGKGGRNQELALAAVDQLAGLQNVMFITLATDGDDGPTDAAGAVATGESAQRAKLLGSDVADYLSRNDSYSYFESLGDLLKTGPTGTNVNDLLLMCIL